MDDFKTTSILCRNCNRTIMVRMADYQHGSVQCRHKGCDAVNLLVKTFYDQAILNGLPGFGELVATQLPAQRYPLRAGVNVVGTSKTATVCLDRDQFIHHGKCYISRRHCTIHVEFDTRMGNLRYTVQDGAVDPDTGAYVLSKNSTIFNTYKLQNDEALVVAADTLIGLGMIDTFRIIPYQIPPAMLETFKRTEFDLNGTT